MDGIRKVLKEYFGYDSLRGGQEPLIRAQLRGRDVMGVMPTGGGKSLCYQIPALLLPGVTLVVSPLISLMQDQVQALGRAGVPAAYINSTLTAAQITAVCRGLEADRYKLLYVAPERLLTDRFLQTARRLQIGLLAVDEAHCISQWGQDFRPSYLRIPEFLQQLPRRPVVSAFTATATAAVREDVERLLGLRDPLRVITGFDRPNLRFEVRRPKRKPEELLRLLRQRPGRCGIVYCATRREVEVVCDLLRHAGFPATRYHAGLEEGERKCNQEDFLHDRATVMVATNAFGMGIDKSNVSFVIHYSMPQSLEAYYQEAGRAGRDGEPADCILLYGANDVRTARFLLDRSGADLPPEDRAALQEQDLLRLERMIGYCRTDQCLRGWILDYFGQQHLENCGNCSNCQGETARQDITREAKMILSCVKRIQDRLGYPMGQTVLIQVLAGSRAARISELGLDSLSTYGLLKKLPKERIRAMTEALENRGLLRTDPAHGGITLTSAAGGVLFGEEQVTLRVKAAPTAPAVPAPAAVPETAPGLIDALRAARARIARQEQIPAYIVCTNATLQDLAAKAPTTMDQLLQVSGIGRHKAARYGDQLLEVVRKYIKE